MGCWGYEPWDSDEAADWFHNFFKTVDISIIEREIEEFDHKNEECYDDIRAAAYIVQCLCTPYVWPMRSDDDDPKALILKLITILSKMINPAETEWTFLAMFDEDKPVPELIRSMENQISQLKLRASEWV